MVEWLAEYGLFLAKGITAAVLVLVVILVAARVRREGDSAQEQGHLSVDALNERYQQEADGLRELIWDERRWKQARRERKAEAKKAKQDLAEGRPRPRVFVLNFHGDLAASAVNQLRHEISALLAVADAEHDEVVLLLESPGGLVHGYGLAASQLARIRSAGLRLTICVDKMAASGGYLMACIGSQLLAAPFAIIGSIGVVAQVPNIHRLLKRHDVDVEVLTAGQYKRTLTVLGENTPEGRAKFQSELEETHALFKSFVGEWRPQVNLDQVGTGEHWYGSQAVSLKLVDELRTSDDYLRARASDADLFALRWSVRKTLGQRLGLVAEAGIDRLVMRWWQRGTSGPRW